MFTRARTGPSIVSSPPWTARLVRTPCSGGSTAQLINFGIVIDQGRGERHPISGSSLLVKEYLTIYTPRDDDELRVVDAIMRASIGYMTGSREVREL